MATFTWVPDYGAKEKIETNSEIADFGGGYSQAVSFGMNPSKRTWDVIFTGPQATIDAIKSFLQSVGYDVQFFTWTPPTGAAGNWKLVPKSLNTNLKTFG